MSSRDHRRTTAPTRPAQIDYVVLICKACDCNLRIETDPPLVGAVQLRHWFAEHSRPCECGAVEWIVKAHQIGKPAVGVAERSEDPTTDGSCRSRQKSPSSKA